MQKLSPKPHSFFTSVLLGVIAFFLLLGVLEGFSHTKYISKIFKLQSVGSYHTQFELKWYALQDYVKSHNGVDVIILGNSMVNTGIDPTIVESRYKELSGQDLRVFNFGVEGLTVEPLSVIAEIINKQFHPGTIILYTEMRDYIAENGLAVSQQFLDNPWIRSQVGIPSIEGDLLKNTSFFKYLLTFRNWSGSNFLDNYLMAVYRKGNMTSSGYEPDQHQGDFIGAEPDPNDPEQKSRFESSANFSIDPSRALNLQNIIALKTSGTRVIVTEMPVYPTYYAYFGNPSVSEKFESDLQALVETAGGAFLPPIPADEIPISGRVDDHHLNFIGAPIYSELLANQLFNACENQNICIYPAAAVVKP